MKKFFLMLAAVCATFGSIHADNPLGNLLGGLKSGTEQGSDNKGSGLGNVLGGVIGGLLSTDKVEPASMVGTWKYESPAVCFKTDDLLKKAGGSAVAGTIESKLEPMYKMAGLTHLVLTVNEDQTFTMESGKVKLSGTIETDGEGELIFNFKAFNKVNIGKIKTYVTLTAGKQMSVMFDVSKLVTVVKAIGSVSGSTAVKSVSSLLDSYEGVCAGFKLARS